MSRELPDDLEKVLEYLARRCADDGEALEEAVLALSRATMERTGFDREYGDDLYTVFLEVPDTLYDQLQDVGRT